MRFFNTAGPVNPDRHFAIPPLKRWDLEEVLSLIEQEKYFILHAPRQTGKTSALLALRDKLNRESTYRALYINVEAAQAWRENVEEGLKAILTELSSRALETLKDSVPGELFRVLRAENNLSAGLNHCLSGWAQVSPKPLVLFIDEIDSLIGDTLVSVLRQLRAGYDRKPAGFPQSIILCGVRDIKDYKIRASSEKEIITGGSAFNVKAKSLRLGDFDRNDVETLLGQHTTDTGQIFEPGAIELVWTLTNGQPWLVNALAYLVCFETKANRDRSKPITSEMIQDAKEELILSRTTHLDQLADKLKEERVRRVIGPMLSGSEELSQVPFDDAEYVADLGLIKILPNKQLIIPNPIYREVIPRELALLPQTQITLQPDRSYVSADGKLLVDTLLADFQEFFRRHSEHWTERWEYKEAGFQLLLQAYLQKIVNGGGRIEREYALGRGRTDLYLHWRFPGGVQRVVLELKVAGGTGCTVEIALRKGLEQATAYADHCGADETHLMVFDRTPGKKWDEKLFRREEKFQGRGVTAWGV